MTAPEAVNTWHRFLLVAAIACVANPGAFAQDAGPRDFAEFRGTWMLDEKATEGLRYSKDRAGQPVPVDGSGLPIARVLVIATTPTEMTVTRGSALPEIYRYDGSETQARDPRTGASLDERYSFSLAAGLVALTAKTTTDSSVRGLRLTEIVTDALSLPEGNVLKVERQLAFLQEPGGHLRTLAGLRNAVHTFLYRRTDDTAGR